jgi:cation diffusion facilitator CzcD-associated flavoprotein CzcO
VREGGLLEKILFENKLEFAQWLPDDKCWELTTTKSIFLAKYLILATGALSEPSIPDIAGIERYQGKIFHSANWDHEYNLTDKRVAVIGTGASAIQFVPQIQPQVRQLHLFQRTPPWIMPRHDRRITFFERHLFKDFPIAQRLVRSLIYWARELYVFGFVFDLRIMKLGEKIALRHLRTQVRNPVLRDKLTPSYTLGCKRILISNDYYPSLENENVEVVTDSISELTDNTIITRKGEEFEVDAIIFGTGFHVTDLPISDSIVGRDGVSLREYWKEGMHAYKGTCVPGFPNLFLLVRA